MRIFLITLIVFALLGGAMGAALSLNKYTDTNPNSRKYYAGPRNWRVQREKPQNGKPGRIVVLQSSIETVPSRNSKPRYAAIVMTCDQNETSFYLQFGDVKTSDFDGNLRVVLGIDQQEPVEPPFTESANKRVGFWNKQQAIPFIRRLFRMKKLSVTFTRRGKNPMTVNFKIEGIEEAIIPLADACFWRP